MTNPWKILLAGGAVLLAASIATGAVLAQDAGSTPSPEGDAPQATEEGPDRPFERFTARLAENLGVTEQQLEDALRQTSLDLLDEAVAAGRIDEDKAAEIRERIESGEGPAFPVFGPAPGHHRACGFLGNEAAEFLGLTVEELRDRREAGETLAEIAQALGKTRDAFAQFLSDDIRERVQQRVAERDITQERADEILQNAEERVDDLLDGEGGPGCGHPPFGRPDMKDAPEDSSATS